MRLVLALLFVLGTGSLTTAAHPPRTIDISASDDMKYSVTVIRAKAGEPLRLRLVSKGTVPKIAMAHNIVVLKLGTDPAKFIAAGASDRGTDFIAPSMSGAVIAKTPLAGPGETVQVVFSAPAKPGRYPFVCTFAGHFQAGMVGTLIIN